MDHLLPYYLPSNLPGLAGCGRGREAFLCPLMWPLSPPGAWGEALSCSRPHLIRTGRPYQDGHPHFPRARSRVGQRTGRCGQEGPGQGYSVSGRARQPRGAEAPSPEVSGASCRGWGSETSWNTRATGLGWNHLHRRPLRPPHHGEKRDAGPAWEVRRPLLLQHLHAVAPSLFTPGTALITPTPRRCQLTPPLTTCVSHLRELQHL